MMFTYSGAHAFESSIMLAYPDGSHISTLIPALSTVGYEAAYGNSLSQYLLVYSAELGPTGTQVNRLQMYRPHLNRFETVPLPPGDAGPATPSPDGMMYATSVSPPGVPEEARMWTVNLADGAARQLAPYDSQPYQDSLPVWSPDGQWVAFLRLDSSQAPNYYVRVYKVRADGTQLACLTPGNEFVNNIAYAPDGRLVMMSENGVELFDLSSMQRTVILPRSAMSATYLLPPAGIGWSRTQNTIVWVLINTALNRNEVWGVRPDGTDFQMLFSTDQSITGLSFVAR